tara:strand:- start:279 stop:2570 length:2292 start_codon:yes stop_codon:yes gene_type:complete
MDPLITKQIQGVLENNIFNKIIALNLNIPNPILRAIISRVAEVGAVDIVKQVSQASNKELTDIPKNLIGPYNPVNIVNGNNGPTQISNNIDGIIQQQLLLQTTDKIVSKLQSQLRLSLPTDKLGIINFDALAASLVQGITPTVGKTITTAVGGFTDAIFGRNQTPKVTTNNIETLFGTLPPEDALAKADEIFDASIANSALNEAKNFDINSTENREKLEVLERGFTDPNANYPTKEYAGISETNKLAQGDSRGTIVQEKNNNRMRGAKLPGGEAWDEPTSAFNGAYPYNKVTQTESGHIIEVDDTPGSERIHVYHRSGTYIEIDSNGSMVRRTKGSSYEIIDRNGKISIAGKADISINGACNIFVGNDANIEVEGDVNLTCHNDITAQAGGTFNLSAVEEFNIASGNVNIEAYYTMNQKATTLNMHSKENMHMRSNADIKVQATNLYDFVSDTVYTQAAGAINIKSGENTNIQSGAEINLLASNNVNLDGSQVHFNSGNAGSASDSAESILAASSNIGVISGRKDISDNSRVDPAVLTPADTSALEIEVDTHTPEEKLEHKNKLIKEGFATAEILDEKPIGTESKEVTSEQQLFIEPDIKLKTVTQLPGNYKLSPNFTVEMLSSKAAVTRDPIQAQLGLTYGEIVFNLQAVALNVLEPIKKLYPNMIVTSAFRSAGNKSNAVTSPHPKGEGVDIQFPGIDKKEYYDIAVKLAKVLKYDQLLLEYKSTGSGLPWIHVGFAVKNRSQLLTFFNQRVHSQGLTQLA